MEEGKIPDGLKSLPFHDKKQMAVLGHMLTNARFFVQCKDVVQANWFNDTWCPKIYAAMVTFHKTHNRVPTYDEVECAPSFLKEENKVRIAIQNRMRDCKAEVQNFGLDTITPELTNWLHARLYHEGMRKSEELFNKEKFQPAYQMVKDTVSAIEGVTFGTDLEETFHNYPAEFAAAENVLKDGRLLTTGLAIFDRILLPDAGGRGCFQPGDTTILLAPTNIGKTTTMITMLMANVRANKKVLFITHEGRAQDIKEKLWCAILQCSKKEMFELYKSTDPSAVTRMSIGYTALARNVTYLPLNKAGMTVEEVESIVRRKQDQCIAQSHDGRGYDLLVVDYPGKLTTTQASGGQFAHRHIMDVVYNRFVQLGLEYNFHVLAAIQSNRDGSRTNRGTSEGRRLLHMEDVSEAWGPMTTATNVISINRDEMAMAKNLITFYVCKSRSSETGWAIACRSDYSRACTHSEKLGATCYRGGGTMVDKLDQMIDDHRGTEVPDAEIIAAGGE